MRSLFQSFPPPLSPSTFFLKDIAISSLNNKKATLQLPGSAMESSGKMLTAEQLKKVCVLSEHSTRFTVSSFLNFLCLISFFVFEKIIELKFDVENGYAVLSHPCLQTADLVNANATEEEKVKAMISQSGEGYDPSQ